jgi:hypothetical protein
MAINDFADLPETEKLQEIYLLAQTYIINKLNDLFEHEPPGRAFRTYVEDILDKLMYICDFLGQDINHVIMVEEILDYLEEEDEK